MKHRLLMLSLALGAVTACHDATGPDRASPFDLLLARQRWSAHAYHDYRYTLQVECYCVQTNPLRVTVIHDTVVAVTDMTTAAAVGTNLGMTVEDLFDVIRDAQRSGTPIEARYDAQLGYPTFIGDNRPALAYDGGAIYTAHDMQTGIFLVRSRQGTAPAAPARRGSAPAVTLPLSILTAEP
jgi:hypothetical protein